MLFYDVIPISILPFSPFICVSLKPVSRFLRMYGLPTISSPPDHIDNFTIDEILLVQLLFYTFCHMSIFFLKRISYT
ncbi:hypothetical protein HanPSC8_Chr16g0717351 [Helianthus annuus]|nr:hypothetical protein HanPSC8_Chr16g0717351 [Helianthus annuus]